MGLREKSGRGRKLIIETEMEVRKRDRRNRKSRKEANDTVGYFFSLQSSQKFYLPSHSNHNQLSKEAKRRRG